MIGMLRLKGLKKSTLHKLWKGHNKGGPIRGGKGHQALSGRSSVPKLGEVILSLLAGHDGSRQLPKAARGKNLNPAVREKSDIQLEGGGWGFANSCRGGGGRLFSGGRYLSLESDQ